MVLSIVQMKDMLSIQQQELLRRQLLYMYEFWECTWDEARLPICLWLEGHFFPTVHITGRTFFHNSTWDEVWPPNCLWLSIIGRTFFPNSTWDEDEDEDVYTVVSPWWGCLYNCVSSQFSPQLDIVSQTQTSYCHQWWLITPVHCLNTHLDSGQSQC